MDTLERTDWRTCPTCGESFKLPFGPGKPRTYCSPECRPSGDTLSWWERDPYHLSANFPQQDVSWLQSAACAGHPNPELFFPRRGESASTARRICVGCPVKQECLDFAIATKDVYGVWGGTTERERRAMRHQRETDKRRRQLRFIDFLVGFRVAELDIG